jgi:hypothetical protein
LGDGPGRLCKPTFNKIDGLAPSSVMAHDCAGRLACPGQVMVWQWLSGRGSGGMPRTAHGESASAFLRSAAPFGRQLRNAPPTSAESARGIAKAVFDDRGRQTAGASPATAHSTHNSSSARPGVLKPRTQRSPRSMRPSRPSRTARAGRRRGSLFFVPAISGAAS